MTNHNHREMIVDQTSYLTTMCLTTARVLQPLSRGTAPFTKLGNRDT